MPTASFSSHGGGSSRGVTTSWPIFEENLVASTTNFNAAVGSRGNINGTEQ
jgi:hypothetical protein